MWHTAFLITINRHVNTLITLIQLWQRHTQILRVVREWTQWHYFKVLFKAISHFQHINITSTNSACLVVEIKLLRLQQKPKIVIFWSYPHQVSVAICLHLAVWCELAFILWIAQICLLAVQFLLFIFIQRQHNKKRYSGSITVPLKHQYFAFLSLCKWMCCILLNV